jgi:hypothetical protein
MEWVAHLKEFGPFTTPLCIALLVALKWVVGQWSASTARERALHETRHAETVETLRVVTESEKLVTAALVAHDQAIKSALKELERKP